MTVQRELWALEDADGMIHAETVVEWASAHPDSELHQRFDWEDTEAGPKWRLHQARQLIARFVVEPVNRHRLTVSLKIDRSDGGGYRALEDVVIDGSLRAHAVNDALSELGRWRERFIHLTELQPLFAMIEQTMVERMVAPPPLRRRMDDAAD